MRNFFGFVLHIIAIRQWKVPSESTQVSEGDYSANIRVNIHVQENKLCKIVPTLGSGAWA